MLLMAACGVLVALGIVAVIRWGGMTIDDLDGAGSTPARYTRSVAIAVAGGLAAGMTVAGAGGRLAMRLLAATAGDRAQGRITEAGEVVGDITLGGTIGFMLFGGITFGLGAAGLYVIVHRWLPAGRAGGALFGALLFVAIAPHVDPIRENNPDFDLVGPGWLALAVFAALSLLHGMAVAAFAARFSAGLPLPAADWRVLRRYWPMILLAPIVAIFVPLVAIGLVVVLVSRLFHLDGLSRRPGLITAGRVGLAVIAVVSLPAFVSAVADIADRGPPFGGTG
jgi:hypothetical protein